MKYGLDESVIQQIKSVFRRYSRIDLAIIYGSRGKLNYKRGSDIDITLLGDLTDSDLANVRDDIQDLNIAHFCDLSHFDQLQSESLKDEIRMWSKYFYSKERDNLSDCVEIDSYLDGSPEEIVSPRDLNEFFEKELIDGRKYKECLNLRVQQLLSLQGRQLIETVGPETWKEIQSSSPEHFEEAIEALKEVFSRTKNDVLRAHFGHVLYNMGERHHDFIIGAIEGYDDCAHKLIQRSFNREQIDNDLGRILWRLAFLSDKLKGGERLKQLMSLVLELRPHTLSRRIPIIEKYHKLFEDQFISQCLKYLYADQTLSRSPKIEALEHGKKLAQKVDNRTYDWDKVIAEEYESMAEQEKKGVRQYFLSEAIKHYKKSGASEDKIRELSNEYRKHARTDARSIERMSKEARELTKALESKRNELENSRLDEIMSFLVWEDLALPHEEPNTSYSFQVQDIIDLMFKEWVLDANDNIVKHVETREERQLGDRIKQLTIVDNYCWQQLLTPLFDGLFSNPNEWSADYFLNYLEQKTWLGEEIQYGVNEGRPVLDFVKKNVEYYFEMRKVTVDKRGTVDFSLFIDSIALKYESLLREVCMRIGIPPDFSTQDGKDRTIWRTKDLNKLMSDGQLVDFLGDRLSFYIKYILTDIQSFNIRNQVAHGLVPLDGYLNPTHADRLILVLLRLAGLNFDTKKS